MRVQGRLLQERAVGEQNLGVFRGIPCAGIDGHLTAQVHDFGAVATAAARAER